MLFLAIRHLLSKKRQTILTLVGITLGTAAYIAISGMMLGFQTFIIDQLVNNDSHIRISAREDFLTEHGLDRDFYSESTLVTWIKAPAGRRDNALISNPRTWMDRLEADTEVSAFSPQLQIQAIANRGKLSYAVKLIGSDPTKQIQVTNIQKSMLQGKFLDLGGGGGRVVLGEGLSKKLGTAMSESIFISVGGGLPQPYKVVGIFNLGVKAIDDGTIFLSLSDLQKLNRTPSRISDFAVRLSHVELASSKAQNWGFLSPDKVQSWDQANEGIMSVFKTQDIVRNSMTISILIVAAFGIYNILSMAVSNKRREVAILRSMGYLSRDIQSLFLTQGIILGIVGGIIGVVLGFLVCKGMAQIPVSKERGLGGSRMMISFLPMIFVRGFLLAFLSSSFASLLPARAAGKLSPIDIIRSENS